MNVPNDTIDRLHKLAASEPRFSSGRFRFPFGEIEYVDPQTLVIQYQEIFIDKLYDFSSGTSCPLIIDCGGNVGLSVVRFKELYPGCRIVAYEADPRICAVLERNVRVLGLADVRIESTAVWTSDGAAQFFVEGGEGGRLTPEGGLLVPTVRLADRISQPVDLLKLDIEGAEWSVLQDLCRSGAIRHVEKLVVEFHGWTRYASAMGEILSSLAQSGFQFTFPWSFCEPGLAGAPEPTPFAYAKDAKFILFLHAWRGESLE